MTIFWSKNVLSDKEVIKNDIQDALNNIQKLLSPDTVELTSDQMDSAQKYCSVREGQCRMVVLEYLRDTMDRMKGVTGFRDKIMKSLERRLDDIPEPLLIRLLELAGNISHQNFTSIMGMQKGAGNASNMLLQIINNQDAGGNQQLTLSSGGANAVQVMQDLVDVYDALVSHPSVEIEEAEILSNGEANCGSSIVVIGRPLKEIKNLRRLR
jgi:hypothetical protein